MRDLRCTERAFSHNDFASFFQGSMYLLTIFEYPILVHR
jgi:hypothetical protein